MDDILKNTFETKHISAEEISSPIKEIRSEHIRGKVKFKAGVIEGISRSK